MLSNMSIDTDALQQAAARAAFSVRRHLYVRLRVRALTVQITRFVDPYQPGWVECSFTDAHGQLHRFVEKGPVVSAEPLDETSSYPCDGVIACEVLGTLKDHGRELSRISTERPWGVESVEGKQEFIVESTKIHSL